MGAGAGVLDVGLGDEGDTRADVFGHADSRINADAEDVGGGGGGGDVSERVVEVRWW